MSTLLFDQYGHPIKVLVDPDSPEQLVDAYGRPRIVVEDATGLDLSAANAIEVVSRRGIFMPGLAFNLNTGNAGDGYGWQFLNGAAVVTGATANSNYCAVGDFFVVRGGAAFSIDFDKAIKLSFIASRENSVAQAVARFLLASGFTYPCQEEDIQGYGFGLEIQNFALYGVSYGSGESKASIDLNTTLVDGESAFIEIVHYPGEKIEWYVDDELKGTQSTPASIPSGVQVYT
jgi:hypothetical protein